MATETGQKAPPLFAQCQFIIVRSSSLTNDKASEITAQIELHGGEVVVDNYPDEGLNLEHVTHIIADDYDFRDYYDAVDQYIQVVKSTWVDASIATGKPAHARRFSPDPHLFMSDVVATCADLPEGDKDAIAGGIIAMGGNHSARLTTQVTHVVALSTESEKADQVLSNNLNIHVVLPHWFDDCLKLGKKIDEGPYKLPNPEILQGASKKAPLGKPNKHVAGATSPTPKDSDSISASARPNLTVLKNRKVLLDSDLQIGPVLRELLCDIIKRSGGKVVDKISTANVLVCKYRDSPNYNTATANKLEVGNLSWLYYLIVHDIWTSPYRRLLHYPVPREPLLGFEKLKISLSNYSGEARTYLENVIIATGAECTKTLKQENTHLVTAHTQSEKVAAAQDWNIVVVNHLWIEESYAKWEMQSVNNPRYNQFPRKTNLGEVVGQTQIDRSVIERRFLNHEARRNASPRTSRKNQSAANPLDASTPAKANARSVDAKTASKQIKTQQQTPATSRVLASGKENVTPTTVGSRASKSAAMAKLHDMTPDIALFEKERKRVGGVVYGGRRKTDEDRVDNDSRKRSAEPGSTDADESQNAKRQRTDSASPQVHLLISGYKAWVGKAKKEEEDISRLQGLGIVALKEPSSKVTHVAVPHIVRTAKFLIAMAQAPVILSTDYIEACLKADKYLDPTDYKLQDKEHEKKFNVSLRDALSHAQANQGKLLEGMEIYCMDKIAGGLDTMQNIAQANGTSITPYRGRAMTMPSRRASSAAESDDPTEDEVYLISSDSKEDKRLWLKFTQTAEANRRKPRIIISEWLLSTALRQQIQSIGEYELNV